MEKRIILLLGCVLFGEAQGTDGTNHVVQVDDVKVFNDKDDLDTFIDELEESGNFDSYMVIRNYENITFNEGEWEKYQTLLAQSILLKQ